MLTRRTLLQGVLAGAVLSGCSSGPSQRGPKVSPGNPFAVADNAPVDVVVSEEYGGFAAAAYRRKYASAMVAPTVNAKLGDAVLPRFAAGTPPDVVLSTGDQALELGRLVKDNQLADLQPLLDAPAWDNANAKVKDSLLPGMLDAGQYDGSQRTLNYVATVYGLWYSAGLFQRNGWDVPRTWPELLALGTDMKAAGLGPFIYAGAHPYYVLELVLTLAAKTGGHEVVKRIDNLDDGAWKDESVTRAITAVGELAKRGLIAPGSTDYDHIGSQKRFLASKAGLLPCGNWLENEMKALIPQHFGLTMIGVPALDGSPALGRGLHVAATAPYWYRRRRRTRPVAWSTCGPRCRRTSRRRSPRSPTSSRSSAAPPTAWRSVRRSARRGTFSRWRAIRSSRGTSTAGTRSSPRPRRRRPGSSSPADCNCRSGPRGSRPRPTR